jgi:hypothetical protein
MVRISRICCGLPVGGIHVAGLVHVVGILYRNLDKLKVTVAEMVIVRQ